MSKRSGDITVDRSVKRTIGVTPGGGSGVPASKGPAGSSYITVDRAVKSPPTRKPSK